VREELKRQHTAAVKNLNAALENTDTRNSLLLLAETQAVIDTATELGTQVLLEQLHHPYWLVRSMACETIGDQNYMPGCSTMAFLLKDEHPAVRVRAREAIEQIHNCRLSDEDCEQLFRSVVTPEVSLDKYPRAPRIFISYSRKDSGFADRFVKDLKAANVSVWIDVDSIADEDASEAQIVGVIEPGIRGSDYLALVLSAHSHESWWVERELRIARIHQNVRNPIAVCALLIDRTDLPDALRNYAPLLRFNCSDPRGYQSSVRALADQVFVPK